MLYGPSPADRAGAPGGGGGLSEIWETRASLVLDTNILVDLYMGFPDAVLNEVRTRGGVVGVRRAAVRRLQTLSRIYGLAAYCTATRACVVPPTAARELRGVLGHEYLPRDPLLHEALSWLAPTSAGVDPDLVEAAFNVIWRLAGRLNTQTGRGRPPGRGDARILAQALAMNLEGTPTILATADASLAKLAQAMGVPVYNPRTDTLYKPENDPALLEDKIREEYLKIKRRRRAGHHH